MLVFENKGEIDVRGITTFGTSVKKGSSPIGFFGTGLKYAIAVLLRHGLGITLYSGNKKYQFITEEILMRGQEFKVVKMLTNDSETELAFTTELGKNWELWQAYRELYCNTVDEGGTVLKAQGGVRGRKGRTRILVEGLDEVHAESDEFILRGVPLYELSEIDIHKKRDGENGAVFYHGIKVYQPSKPMLYNYNLKRQMELTEDRTLKYYWVANYAIIRSLIVSPYHEPIEEIVCCSKDYYEAGFDFNSDAEGRDPNEVFLAAMGTFSRVSSNQSARKYYNEYAMEHITNLPKMALSDEQKSILSKAKKLLVDVGWTEIYSVVVTDMLDENTMSNAKSNTIYLNTAIFGKPVEVIAEVIFDNYLQLSQGALSKSWLIQSLLRLCNPNHQFQPEQLIGGEDEEVLF